jgi:hypothetical protein
MFCSSAFAIAYAKGRLARRMVASFRDAVRCGKGISAFLG